MQKPDSLRAALAAIDPELGRDAARLRMYADQGTIVAPMSESRGFAWSYKLLVFVKQLTKHPSLLFLAITDWLRINQPDLLGPHTPAIHWEAEILDDKTINLAIELDLTEQVRLNPREDGGFDLEHLAEPDPLFPDDVPFSDPAALLKQIWWKDELLVPIQP